MVFCLTTGLTGKDTIPDWLMALTSFAVVAYASMTIHEQRKDRRKDRIEKTLECVYSPLYQIFRQGLMRYFDLTWKNGMEVLTPKKDQPTDLPPSQFKFTTEEYMRILDILTRFGHLMLKPEYKLLMFWTETSKFDVASKLHYLEDKEMGRAIWDGVTSHLGSLRRELDELTED